LLLGLQYPLVHVVTPGIDSVDDAGWVVRFAIFPILAVFPGLDIAFGCVLVWIDLTKLFVAFVDEDPLKLYKLYS